MNIGVFTKPNNKGQIVIPKHIRDSLGMIEGQPLQIVVSGTGVYIKPVREVITGSSSKDLYLKILEQTKGTWAEDDWEETEKRSRAIETEAAKKSRKKW